MDYREKTPDESAELPKPEKEMAVFIMGLLSLVTCALLGPIALMVGAQDREMIRVGQRAKSDLFNIGYILATISTVILVIQVIAVVIFFFFVVLAH